MRFGMASFWAANRGKLALLGLLVLAAGAMAWRNLHTPGQLPSTIRFVCAETGKEFTLRRSDVNVVPAKNPDTGEFTLLPCGIDESGVRRVTQRSRESLATLGERNRYVDPETLEVRPPS
jgi:hypothetical protein